MDAIQAFYDRNALSAKIFYWIDFEGTQHKVRFAMESFDPTGELGWDNDGYGVKGFSVTVTLRKVWNL